MTEPWTEEQILAGRRLFAGPSRFIMGVTALEQLPPALKPEIAFAGRSNAGKSSLINALTGKTGLARASNTPGRTRELNFFDIGDVLTLVDMPGYGYAKAAKADVAKWQALLRAYLRGRPGLRRAFVLVDARHGPKSADERIFALLDEAAVTFQIVLTKADKLSPKDIANTEQIAEAVAKKHAAAYPHIHTTSAVKGTGLPELRAEIAALVNYGS
ncbi:MAG: ribosome biogenesis GTP-binding protein YihA/YsxC [Hyphomicrobiales bacterium]